MTTVATPIQPPGPRAEPVPVYLDCDTGVDDAVALAYLLRSAEIELVGIGTVSGNVAAATGARNTLDLLALAGITDLPVAVGAHDPTGATFAGGAPHVHGDNGVGSVTLPRSAVDPAAESAAEMVLRLSHQYPGRLQVLAVGPLTNLALAVQADPSLPDRIAHLTVMGGAALCQGNVTPVAEANIFNDPEAAQAVLQADWAITLVPLDATLHHVLEEDDRRRLLDSGDPLLVAVGEVLDLYFDFYVQTYGRRCCALHDPLAAAVLTGGILAEEAPVVGVVVDDTRGPGRGQTICDLRGRFLGHPEQPGAHVRVVLSTTAPLAPHLMQRLLGP